MVTKAFTLIELMLVISIILIIAAITIPCLVKEGEQQMLKNQVPSQAEAAPNQNKQRFEIHHQNIEGSITIYRIHDKQTGQDYLTTQNGGLIEIQPTNKELPYDK